MKWHSYHTKNLKTKYLFKFLSRTNTDKFLESGGLWFSRADEFGDKMECVLINDIREKRPDFEKIEERKRRTLISCWHLAEVETLALWDTYPKKQDERRVCAIRFKRDDLDNLVKKNVSNGVLKNDVKRLLYGKVLYKDLLTSENFDKKKIKYNAFRKERAFSYESEYRFVIQLNSKFEDNGLNYSIGDPSKLPFKIIVNPLLPSAQYKQLKESINQRISFRKGPGFESG